MKWMWSIAFVLVTSAVASAQSSEDMNKSKAADTMKTYSGCVEAVNHGAWYLLTHVDDEHQAMMRHEAMMKTESGRTKDAPTASNGMPDDHMMPSAVALSGRSDLKKHVGQKVEVSGTLSHDMSNAMPNHPDTLAVASLKVIAKSCR